MCTRSQPRVVHAADALNTLSRLVRTGVSSRASVSHGAVSHCIRGKGRNWQVNEGTGQRGETLANGGAGRRRCVLQEDKGLI